MAQTHEMASVSGADTAVEERARRTSQQHADGLWEAHRACPTLESRNRLMEHFFPLVKRTAERVRQRLPENVELDDLVSAGVFGLRDAINGFDPERGVKFATYCTTRVRGAILDELRSNDWVPRLVRSKSTKVERSRRELEVELGRNPTDREFASRLNLSHGEFDELMKESRAVQIGSLSEQWSSAAPEDEAAQLRKIDVLEDRRQKAPSERAQRRDLIENVLRGLTSKERLIVLLYYVEELTMREIGTALGLSESRVCQLHTRIMKRLREQLGKSRNDLLG